MISNRQLATVNSSHAYSDTQKTLCRKFSANAPNLNEFSSPNYPFKYLPNLDCLRIIQGSKILSKLSPSLFIAPVGYDILLNFDQHIFQV